jgi:16S rRNA (cytidine1402-2'-O)-methyltransferase
VPTADDRGTGRLSVVATPIGNLEDITLRALRVLREADRILAEDTRRTKRLCEHHGIATPLASLHAHSPDAKVDGLVAELTAGRWLALVSDAGTPLVSDPGASLVARAAAAGVTVEAIPGPSAVTAALAVAAIPVDAFRFVGFLPRSGGRRARSLEEIAKERGATVVFEAPTRVRRTLEDLARHLGSRRVALCRELTKMHEEIVRGTAGDLVAALAARDGELRGEVTLVIEGTGAGPGAPEELDDDAIDARIADGLARGVAPKQLARDLAERTTLSRSEAYRRVLAARAED